jgi:hypothetical protein
VSVLYRLIPPQGEPDLTDEEIALFVAIKREFRAITELAAREGRSEVVIPTTHLTAFVALVTKQVSRAHFIAQLLDIATTPSDN